MKSTEIGRIVLTTDLSTWISAFINNRRSRRLSERTIDYYSQSLASFAKFCEVSTSIDVIDSNLIYEYLDHLKVSGLNPGGVHARYRAVKAFFNWYAFELDDPAYRNPMRKVRLKEIHTEPLKPADIDVIKQLLKDCERPILYHPEWLGLRDKLIILMLLDTGLRASELLSLSVNDVDPITGLIHLKHGKGDKPRPVFMSRLTRQTYRKYLKEIDPPDILILNEKRYPITYSGIRLMLESRAERVGLPYQSPHSFRRLCALEMYRATNDIYAVQRYLGHENVKTTMRYLRLTEEDALKTHLQGSPVEKWVK